MPDARIYQPSRTAMQQGLAKTKFWLLEFAPSGRREQDQLMGWTSSDDTRAQLRMKFDTCEEAVAYATRNDIAYKLVEPQQRRPRIKSYADNFRFDRVI
ncbi:MAG: ETC complex I subunit [Alphaproteobacteria bacterium]|jgi:hypothetical protein